MRYMLFLALVMSSTLSLFGNTSFAQSLDENLQGLLRYHPAIQAARRGVEASQASADISTSSFLPTLSVSGDIGKEKTNNQFRRDAKLGSIDLARDKYTFTLRQNLFNGFRDINDLDAAEANVLRRESELGDTIAREMLRGIIAYVDVLQYSKIVELSRQREATIAEQMQLENERVERGSGIELDVLEAKSRLRIAKEKTVSQLQKLEQAAAAYERSFGHAANVFEMQDVTPPIELLPSSLDKALELAVDLRDSIKMDQFEEKRWQSRREAEKGGYYPSIDLIGTYDYEDDVGATAGSTRTSTIIMQANWELFSGFETNARVREAAHNISYYYGLAQDKTRQAEEDVMQTWSELQLSRERYDLLVSALDIAEEVFASRQKLRDGGKETAINLLDSESQVYDSQIKLIEMDYVSRKAVFKVLEATGLLQPENLGL